MEEYPGRPDAEAGQAVYTRPILSVYDIWVLGISNHFIWRCPTRRLRQLYHKYVSSEHLDVGVGTGYYLDKCSPKKGYERLTLLDMNQNSLDKTAGRIHRYSPELFRANVLEPLTMAAKPFQSIAVNYLFHCLPGSLPEKGIILDHLAPWLAPDGLLFGATLLGKGVKHTKRAQSLMAFYNEKGIFSNLDDSLDDLHRILDDRYQNYQVEVIGCCALFVASNQ